MKADSTLSEGGVVLNRVRNIDKMIKFRGSTLSGTSHNKHGHLSSCPYKRQHKAYQCLWQQSPLNPQTCVTNKVTCSGVLGKSSATISTSAGAPNLSGSVIEQYGDNRWPGQLFRAFMDIYWFWIYIGCTPHTAHLRKTHLQKFITHTAGNMLAVAAIGNMYCRKYVSSCNSW